jgi:glutathione S-transferase
VCAKAALQLLEESLDGDFLVGSAFTLADIALVPYTRMAEDGALNLGDYPRVRAWIGRVEQSLGLGPYASTHQ